MAAFFIPAIPSRAQEHCDWARARNLGFPAAEPIAATPIFAQEFRVYFWTRGSKATPSGVYDRRSGHV